MRSFGVHHSTGFRSAVQETSLTVVGMYFS